MYGTRIVNAYILFGKVLQHIYIYAGGTYKSDMYKIEKYREKKRKSIDPMRGKFDFSP